MKEINIAHILVNKRKERKITQDELADYLGVTKAAISKWETGQSYPDITLLPLLAGFYSISIDELIDYKPQMKKEEIRKLYTYLCKSFVEKSFEEVMEECEKVIRKYYSCSQLLIQMGVLLLNHHMLALEAGRKEEILGYAQKLFGHIKEIEKDPYEIKKTIYLEACCSLMMGKPHEVISALGNVTQLMLSEECLLCSAYAQVGEEEKAIETMQVGIYQRIFNLVEMNAALAGAYRRDREKTDMWVKSFFELIELYQVASMHPMAICPNYLEFAVVYLEQGRQEEALDMLDLYADTIIHLTFPVSLETNQYFDRIEGWIEELDLGKAMPRSEEVVKASIIEVLEQNPKFEQLRENIRFQSIVRHVKSRVGIPS